MKCYAPAVGRVLSTLCDPLLKHQMLEMAPWLMDYVVNTCTQSTMHALMAGYA